MQYCDRPEVLVLRGEEAIEVLQKYIQELEEARPKELTKKQAAAMIKLANGLMSAIKEEAATSEPRKKPCVASRLTAVTGRVIQWFAPKSPASDSRCPSEQSRGYQSSPDSPLK